MKKFYHGQKFALKYTISIASLTIILMSANGQAISFKDQETLLGMTLTADATHRFEDTPTNAGMPVKISSLFNYEEVKQIRPPVKLSSFIVFVQEKQVKLSWITAQEKNLSHFSIEKSADGINYTDVGIIFTEDNSDSVKSYTFRDPLNISTGILYYRLKMVDLDGKSEYSPLRFIKPGSGAKDQILQVFPNPVIDKCRITIPEAWQSREVTYDLYDSAGLLLKRIIRKNAGPAEMLDLQMYKKGNYLIKAYSAEEVLSEKVIKR